MKKFLILLCLISVLVKAEVVAEFDKSTVSPVANNELITVLKQQELIIHDLKQDVVGLALAQQHMQHQIEQSKIVVSPLLHLPYIAAGMTDWPTLAQWWVLFLAVVIVWAMLEFGDVCTKQAELDISSKNNNCDDDHSDEYDFFNTEEGLSSQLDLAQAYLEMGDFVSARLAADTVIASNEAELADQAKLLLVTILDKQSRQG